jgi:hypothetical protein
MEAAAHFQKTGKRLKRTINTRDILFIVSGAFNGLDEIVSKRLSRGGLGFEKDLKQKDSRNDLLKLVKPEDLVEYGFESEFVGRLPVLAVLDDLDRNDLFKILKNRYSSVVTAKKQDFKAYGIDIRFTDEALQMIADLAQLEKTGARSLISVMERLLVAFESRLPSTDLERFCVTADLVNDPRGYLEAVIKDEAHPSRNEMYDVIDREERVDMLRELELRAPEFEKRCGKCLTGAALDIVVDAAMHQGISPDTMYTRYMKVEESILEFEREFEGMYAVKIRFLPEALQELIRLTIDGSDEPLIVCRKIFQNYHHGLKLVMERTGWQEFKIPKEAVENPEHFLNEMIQKTYRSH